MNDINEFIKEMRINKKIKHLLRITWCDINEKCLKQVCFDDLVDE